VQGAVGKYARLSERRACQILGVDRSTLRHAEVPLVDETSLRHGVLEVANLYGRYSYRTVCGLLSGAGWQTSEAVVRRIWRQEGLKEPAKQPARARLWLNDGSCVRLRPERINHARSYDFVQGHTYCPWFRRWRKFRILMVIDEFSRECLALYVARTIKAVDVIDVLSDLMLELGVPEFIRSDNGPEFVATILRNWLKSLGTNTAYITPGSPWRTGIARALTASSGISGSMGSCSTAWGRRWCSLSNGAFTSTHCRRINRLEKSHQLQGPGYPRPNRKRHCI
jgi:transposase InsO family protein